jgi:prepilin-type N-terminal cleavage/methylation domain-containing protein
VPRPLARSAAGFTLLELLVGVVVSSIIVMLAMMAWKPMSSSTLLLRDRARDTTELRLAVESMLQDLGGADTALPTLQPEELHIVREQAVAELAGAWSSGADAGIVYSLSEGDLERHDVALGSSVIVASGLETFDVERVAGSETHVTLRVGEGLGERQVELVWPR